MEERIVISSANATRFNNSRHYQYQFRMYGIFTGGIIATEKIHLTDSHMAEWKGYIDVEGELNQELVATAATQEMDVQEQLRDDIVTFLFDGFRSAAKSPFPEKRRAGMYLVDLADKNAGLQTQALDVETANIRSLVHDLRKPEFAAHVTTLGLDEVVDALETENDKYETMHMARQQAKASNNLPPAKEVRPLSDEMLLRACILLEASYLMSESEEDKAAMRELARQLNAQIAASKTAHNESQAQLHGPGSGGGSGTNPGTLPEDGGSSEGGDGTDGSNEPDEPTPNPDEGGGTPDEGGETPDEGGSTPDEGGETPTPTPGGGDDDEEVVG